MSNPKKTHELIRQNEQLVKKSQKHDANLQKNSTLYFQVGLIVCLFMVYGLLEMKFATELESIDVGMVEPNVSEEIRIENFQVYEEPKVEMRQEAQQVAKLIDEVTIVDDDTPLKEALKIITAEENTTSDPIDIIDIVVEGVPEEAPPVDFVSVEFVPIYPGCENKKTNLDKRKCMSDKITKLVQKKFDTDLGSSLGLSGKQVIRTQFKIDKTGRVTEIKTRGTHPELEKEAKRVINYIPEMTPGKQRDKNVSVIYTLPIVFSVQN
ncbi:energy transducer TonB [Algibacter miyuki]|uniref:Energy transducer TonB n=1 Tax=Algibacter miyuki TaxID=1306933 RepID=A0ABV5GUG9_9FLAO|nr:energy transducer TonB [Algibacter miyuki]MDN3664609.1 energy transducer TonB [Algibacter miyuki]